AEYACRDRTARHARYALYLSQQRYLIETYERADVEHHRTVSAARQCKADAILGFGGSLVDELIEGHLRLRCPWVGGRDRPRVTAYNRNTRPALWCCCTCMPPTHPTSHT